MCTSTEGTRRAPIALHVSDCIVQRDLVRAALRALGIDDLVLAVHDASFPSFADEETGRGSPYTRGGHAMVSFASELGFNGIQLGPQGQTSLGNSSPYDGSVFSKSLLSVALTELASARFASVLRPEEVEAIVEEAPTSRVHAHYNYAFQAHERAVNMAAGRLRAGARAGESYAVDLAARVAAFGEREAWVRHDAIFEALTRSHGTDDWHRWPEADRSLLAPGAGAAQRARVAQIERDRADVVDAWFFGQFVLSEQHALFRAHAHAVDLRLFGDLQVGLSHRDTWSRADLFLASYVMGAPPSRTNPQGQPWGYPVLDPARHDGTTLAFMRARIEKLLDDCDGVRIDHPHGLVCPWVYDATASDDQLSVQRGARLFESPDDPAHPALAPLAIARPDELDRFAPLYADMHVRWLDDAQVARYAIYVDEIVRAAEARGLPRSSVVCEVLSTCPLPLQCVMARHNLGRFRVTQKANVTKPDDSYRSDNAKPEDWIMIGNHDTDPLLLVIDRWRTNGSVKERAAYLASRLEPDETRRARFANDIANEPSGLARAMFAELFASRAKHVMVFFADLFGMREIYNTPGILRPDNWTIRVPRDFRTAYAEACARGEGLDLPRILAVAMRARGEAFVRDHEDLIKALERARE
ncbi:MAG: 4-alpha-glucanotransferase [Polyangiaceae bacterium]|nr:4-alpha-glucanotransferase [Polyangiaceae bacterium]